MLYYDQLGEQEICRLPVPKRGLPAKEARLLASQVIAEMGVNQGEEGGGEVQWERVVGRREREGKRQRNDQLAIKTKHLNRCCRKL